jgi:predicted nucleic acid-binding protein
LLSESHDPERVFVTSAFVRIEIFPKAIYYKRQSEVAFYEDFFSDAEQIVPLSEPLSHLAYTEACHAGLSGLDALHIAAAKSSKDPRSKLRGFQEWSSNKLNCTF